MAISLPPNKAKSKTAQVLSLLGNRKTKHVEPEEAEASNEEVWLISYSDLMTLLFGFFVILFSMSTLDKNKYDSFKQGAAKQFGGEYQMPTENLKREVDASLKDSGVKSEDVQVTQTVEGLELNFKGQAFFLSGSADLAPQARTFILKAVQAIKETGNDYAVRVEGHTDDVPIRSAIFPSNWELSSARATAVLRMLEENGVDARQLEALGYGSSRPLKPNRDAQNKAIDANMAQNRRIVVKLRKMEPSEMKKLNLKPTATSAAHSASPTPSMATGPQAPGNVQSNSAAIPASPAVPAPAAPSAMMPPPQNAMTPQGAPAQVNRAPASSGSLAGPSPSVPSTSIPVEALPKTNKR